MCLTRLPKISRNCALTHCYVFPDDTGESAGKSGTETFWRGFNIYESLEGEKYDQLLRDGLREQDIEVQLTDEIESRFQRHIHEFQKSGYTGGQIASIVGDDILRMTRIICDLARKRLPGLEERVVFPLAIHLKYGHGADAQSRAYGVPRHGEYSPAVLRGYYEAACYAVDEIQKKYIRPCRKSERHSWPCTSGNSGKDMAQEGE